LLRFALIFSDFKKMTKVYKPHCPSPCAGKCPAFPKKQQQCFKIHVNLEIDCLHYVTLCIELLRRQQYALSTIEIVIFIQVTLSAGIAAFLTHQ
jgi:hypothetical protein